jgi:endonuclease/exonuclease/phosphatase family metal-dependent hydrolase
MGYADLAVTKGNDSRGINVGILSKFPLKRVLSHADMPVPVPGEATPRKLARDLLQATVEAPGGDLEVFVVHLKSSHIPNGHEIADMARKAGVSFDEMKAKLLGEAAEKREAEAVVVRQYVAEWNAANPGKPSVLLGDGNDVPTSKTVQILLGLDDQGEKLHNLVADELGPEAYTHHSPGGFQSEIDQLDVDDDLLKKVVPGSTTIVRTQETEAASDHRPPRFTVDPTR